MFYSPAVTDFLDMELLEFFRAEVLPNSADLGSPASIEDYELQILHFNRAFRHRLAEDPSKPALRNPVLRDLLQGGNQLVRYAMDWQVARGRAKITANKINRVVCRLWNYAFDPLHCLPAPPRCKQFAKPKLARKAWTPEEFQLILNQASKMPELNKPVGRGVTISKAELITTVESLIANVGGRITATMLAGPKALDHDRRTLKLEASNQKQAADQVFQLKDDVYEALMRLEPGKYPRLIPWPYDENWDFQNDYWRTAQQIRAKRWKSGKWVVLRNLYRGVIVGAGFSPGPKDLFHGIRACVATWIAAELGEPAAQAYMGHSGPEVTRVYLDYSQIRKERSAIDVLPKFQLRLFSSEPSAVGCQQSVSAKAIG